MLSRLTIGIAAVLLSGPALAADMGTPDYAGMFDWSGFYVGAEIGGLRMQTEISSVENDASGPIFGAVAGYNYVNGNMLVGIEGDVGYSSAKISTECPNPTWTCEGYADFQGSLRGRIGYATDSLLVYLTGGVAAARVGGATISPTDVEYPDESVRVGYTVGGGIEAALSENLSGRVQYLYANYGKRDMEFDGTYPDVAVDTHAIKAGLLFHFN